MKEALPFLHYVVEIFAVVAIGAITMAYLSVGYDETPIILGAFTAITTIAGVETYRKHKESKNEESVPTKTV
jgi:hypothetical protein